MQSPQQHVPAVVQASERCTHNDCLEMLTMEHWPRQHLALGTLSDLPAHV